MIIITVLCILYLPYFFSDYFFYFFTFASCLLPHTLHYSFVYKLFTSRFYTLPPFVVSICLPFYRYLPITFFTNFVHIFYVLLYKLWQFILSNHILYSFNFSFYLRLFSYFLFYSLSVFSGKSKMKWLG